MNLEKNEKETMTRSANHWTEYARRQLSKRSPDRFEIYIETRRGLQIDIKDQKIDSFLRSQDLGLSVRVLKNKKMGGSFCTHLSESAVERAIDSAFAVLNELPEDKFHQLYDFGSTVYPEIHQWSDRSLQTPIEDKIKKAIELEKACRDFDPRIKALRSASMREIATEVILCDSSGAQIKHKATRYTLSALCKSEDQGETQTGYDFDFSWDLSDLDPAQIGGNAAKDALELLGAKIPNSTQCPVVFPSRIMCDLIGFISSSFSEENIDKRKSMLVGKLDQTIFSNQVTFIDDGLYPNGLGTTPFDGEGIPKKKTILVEDGQFIDTLRDLYQSKKTGKPPTASTHRSLQSAPSIGPSNFYLKPGKKTYNELIGSIQKGAVITHLMGIHTANPITGQFSLGASGLWIENGKISHPIREFAVAGNMIQLFSQVEEIGSDLRFYGTTGSPSAIVSQLSIGGRS